MRERRLSCVPDLVEFLEADERVLVRRVGVKKLVLHEAGHPAELRNVASQQIDLVHGTQGGGDVAALVENLEKRLVVFRVVDEVVVHQRDVVAQQLREVGVKLEAALLGVQEHAHESSRLIPENTR